MQNPAKNPLYRPLCLMLAVVALAQVAVGFSREYAGAALLWQLLFGIANSFIAFVWFCRDSDARNYRRSLLRNIGFNSFSIVFLPYYLVRSRAAGQKWGALLRLAGFGVLMLIAAAIGLMLAALMRAMS